MRYLSVSLFCLIFFGIRAEEYHCPMTPTKITLGKKTEDGWLPWPKNDEINNERMDYYRKNPTSFYIETWQGMTNGTFIFSNTKKETFIGCCKRQKETNFNICVYKFVKFKNCNINAPLGPNQKDKFECSDVE